MFEKVQVSSLCSWRAEPGPRAGHVLLCGCPQRLAPSLVWPQGAEDRAWFLSAEEAGPPAPGERSELEDCQTEVALGWGDP